MALKTFKIDYNGNEEEVEYDDDIEYGKIAPILKGNVDASNPMQSKVNIPEYQIGILITVITKAPFQYNSSSAILKLPSRTVVKLIDEIMNDYAMGIFLEGWMKTLLGSDNLTKFITEATPTAQQPSAGTKKPSTNNLSTGSKTSQT